MLSRAIRWQAYSRPVRLTLALQACMDVVGEENTLIIQAD